MEQGKPMPDYELERIVSRHPQGDRTKHDPDPQRIIREVTDEESNDEWRIANMKVSAKIRARLERSA